MISVALDGKDAAFAAEYKGYVRVSGMTELGIVKVLVVVAGGIGRHEQALETRDAGY